MGILPEFTIYSLLNVRVFVAPYGMPSSGFFHSTFESITTKSGLHMRNVGMVIISQNANITKVP